jgi:hypothetical protein
MNDFREPHPAKNLHLLFGHVWYWYLRSAVHCTTICHLSNHFDPVRITTKHHFQRTYKGTNMYHLFKNSQNIFPTISKGLGHHPVPRYATTQLAQILDREKRQWYKCCRQFSPKFKCLLAARRKLRFSGCWAKRKKTQGGPPNIKKKWVIFDMFFLKKTIKSVAILTQNKLPEGMWIDCSMLMHLVTIHKIWDD